MLKQSLALALAAAAMLGAPAAYAATPGDAVKVSYTDLNLSSEKGQKILERRLDKAAREVCGMDERTTGTRMIDRDSKSCYDGARSKLAREFADVVSNTRRGG